MEECLSIGLTFVLELSRVGKIGAGYPYSYLRFIPGYPNKRITLILLQKNSRNSPVKLTTNTSGNDRFQSHNAPRYLQHNCQLKKTSFTSGQLNRYGTVQ